MAEIRGRLSGVIPSRLRWLPVAAAWIACVLAGVRAISTEDLGYHLAYGERFLQTGVPVDHHPNLYTLPPRELPASARPAPGPGCWYDTQGRYRFANANWLSQVVMAVAYRVGGVTGLSVMLVSLVGILLALLVWIMHRLEVPPPLIAVVLLGLVLLTYQRLTLRPELFGYVVLLAQLALLADAWRGRRLDRPLPWKVVLGLIALQAVFVNVHSYFLLGIAVTGALLVGSVTQPQAWATRAGRLAVAVAGQVAVCLVNPWGWRLAALPVETVVFLREHDIAEGPSAHPWTSMGDIRRPVLFEAGWTGDLVAIALVAGLAVVILGATAAVFRRRWDWLLLMSGMTLVAVSAQRNIAVGMLVAVPFAAAALAGVTATKPWQSWATGLGGRVARVSFALAVVGVSAGLGWSLVTSHLYVWQDSPLRYGAGLSHASLPIGAAEWIDEYDVRGRVWASPVASSTIYGFTDTSPALNMVTNTWAYPPDVMRYVLASSGSYRPQPFGPIADAFDVSVVVARPGEFLRMLAADDRWTPVHVEGPFAVLVRRDGPDGHLAERWALPFDERNVEWIVQRTHGLDPRPATVLALTGRLLCDLGEFDAALELLAEARRADSANAKAWVETANTLTYRMTRRGPDDLDRVREDLNGIVVALGHAARLTGDPQLAVDLAAMDERLQWIRSATAVTVEAPTP